MLLLIAFVAILAVVPVLTYVSWRADSASTRWGGIVAISLTFLVIGFFIPPLLVGVVIGPLLWVLTRTKDTSVRWDKLDRERTPATPATAEQIERAQQRAAKGVCPSCGARNKRDQERCRVCGSLIHIV